MKVRSDTRLATPLFRAALFGVLSVPALAFAQATPNAAGQISAQTPAPASAEPAVTRPLTFEPSVTAELVFSDNGNFGLPGEKKSEITAVVTPRLGFRRDSPNFRLNGSLGFSSYSYSNDTQQSTVLPTVDVALLSTVIRDWFTVDAFAKTREFLLAPLTASSDGSIAKTKYNAFQSRIAPKLAHEFASNVRFSAVTDNAWTTYSGDSAGRLIDAYVGSHQVELALRPSPFGWSVRATRDETKYDVVTLDKFSTDAARAGVEYLFGTDFIVGLGGGREKNRFPGFSADGSTSYGSFRWKPSPGTSVFAESEKRFFGNAWQFDAQYRSPTFALGAGASRRVESFQGQLLSFARAGTVATLIDNILIGRISDPVQRAQAVQDLINRRALPAQIDQATAIYSERVQLMQSARISAAILGARNSVVLVLTKDQTEEVPGFEGVLQSLGLLAQATSSTGATLSWNRRLSATSGLESTLAASESKGAGLISGKARQTRAQLTYSIVFSPSTTGAMGYRHQRYELTGADPSKENGIFALVTARFN